MSFVVMHIDMSDVLLMKSIFMFITAISPSLFSVCFYLNSQSAIFRSGPGLYVMHILY